MDEPGRLAKSCAKRIDRGNRPGPSHKSHREINVLPQDNQHLDASHPGRSVLKNGPSNYLGFAIKLDKEFDDAARPMGSSLQGWQCCSLRTLPPLGLSVIPDLTASSNSIRFAMIARNDDDIADKPHRDLGEHLRVLDGTPELSPEHGRRYNMALLFEPDPGVRIGSAMQSQSGVIDLRLDGAKIQHRVGALGDASAPPSKAQDPYAVEPGLCRAAHPARQQVFFNDIGWGTDRPSADPDRR